MANRRTAGFSLIELLIVVAIIAALVGVAVPMFQQNIGESRRAKALADLETIKKAILQHDAHERALIGISLQPLLGRYLSNLPVDPWGNAYALDAGVGVLVSFGSDQKPGGEAEDQDLIVHYRSPLRLQRAVYRGSWGLPVKGAKLRLSWSKPFTLTAADPLGDLVLILDAKRSVGMLFGGSQPFVDGPGAGTVPPELAGASWGEATWAYLAAESDPPQGVMVIECTKGADPANAGDQTLRLSPQYGVNVKSVVATDSSSSTSVIRERPEKGGPLDTALYGADALAPHGALPVERVGDENRGVLLQRE